MVKIKLRLFIGIYVLEIWMREVIFLGHSTFALLSFFITTITTTNTNTTTTAFTNTATTVSMSCGRMNLTNTRISTYKSSGFNKYFHLHLKKSNFVLRLIIVFIQQQNILSNYTSIYSGFVQLLRKKIP